MSSPEFSVRFRWHWQCSSRSGVPGKQAMPNHEIEGEARRLEDRIVRRAPGIHTPVLSCFFAALLFGASTPFSKALLSSIGPLMLAGLLYLGAAAAVLPISLRGSSSALRRDRRQRLLLGLAVLFGGGIGPVVLLLGLRAAPAASVSLWLNMETVATAMDSFASMSTDGHGSLPLWCSSGASYLRRRKARRDGALEHWSHSLARVGVWTTT